MSDFPKWPLVYVEWVDSVGDGHWQHLDGTQKWVPSECRSVGWLANKNNVSVTLYGDLSTHPSNQNAQVNSEMTIPIRAVKRIVSLKPPRRK